MRKGQEIAWGESGIALPLAVIMIVLIGVMGAGLLTFVSTDLISVVAVNKGQRAFEMSDAGVASAKRQLVADCVANFDCAAHYDGGADDVHWSKSTANTTYSGSGDFGVFLEDLDGDGDPTDRVNVTIESVTTPANSFKIISTGQYGDAKRKIEAIITKSDSGGVGLPGYYTPGNIYLRSSGSSNININGVSMLSGKDIIMDYVSTRAAFITDYKDNSGVITKIDTGGANDLLGGGDWDTDDTEVPPLYWNTQPRMKDGSRYMKAGFAAEGIICGGSAPTTCSTGSVADGMVGYDSATGDRGSNLMFVRKSPPDQFPQTAGTISYPFPPPTNPPANYLKAQATAQGRYWNVESSGAPNLSTLLTSNDPNQVTFVDANGTTIDFASDDENAKNKGIFVVRCGRLEMEQKFQGVFIVLKGENGTHGPSTGANACDLTGQYKNQGYQLQGYVFAEGDDPALPGIHLEPSSQIQRLPNNPAWASVLGRTRLSSGAPTIEIQSWREVYQ